MKKKFWYPLAKKKIYLNYKKNSISSEENIINLFDNTDEETLKYANDYFNIMAFGTIFMVLAIFFRSILSGEGETVLPMKILGVGTILNIILDPIFIIVLGLEVAGAAIATVISNGVVAMSFMYFLIF